MLAKTLFPPAMSSSGGDPTTQSESQPWSKLSTIPCPWWWQSWKTHCTDWMWTSLPSGSGRSRRPGELSTASVVGTSPGLGHLKSFFWPGVGTGQGVWKKFSASVQSLKPKMFGFFFHSFQNFGFSAIFRRPGTGGVPTPISSWPGQGRDSITPSLRDPVNKGSIGIIKMKFFWNFRVIGMLTICIFRYTYAAHDFRSPRGYYKYDMYENPSNSGSPPEAWQPIFDCNISITSFTCIAHSDTILQVELA